VIIDGLFPWNLRGYFRSIKDRVFYGWWIVILGSIIQAVGGGILYHSFTVFFLPLKRDLGVSTAAISLLYGAARLEGGVEGPIIGYLIDRWGPRVLVMAGAVLAGVGMILLATVQTYFSFFIVYIFIVSLGFNAGVYHPVSTAVNAWFIRRRALGLSITTAAGNIGGIVMPPLLSYLILDFGWRTGAVIAGLMILAITVPAAIPIRRFPEVMGLTPDGYRSQEEKRNDSPGSALKGIEIDFTVREALGTLQYWVLALAITLRILVTVALLTHLVPVLVWKGMSEASGAYMVSLVALGSILTSLLLGWMGDRWNKALLCSLAAIPSVLSMVGLALSSSSFILLAYPIGLAITFGAIPLNWALIGEFFGRRSFGTLRGIIGMGTGVGTFISPIYAGWIFDRTASYVIVLANFAIILTVASVLFALLAHRSLLAPKKKFSSPD
jgi:MFS family permease